MGLKTFVAIVLDRSGSMKPCYDATLAGVNKQITTIRKDAEEPGVETFVSFYTFNSKVHPQYKCRSVNFLEDLTERDYVIGGNTAIYDAMGTVVTDFQSETDHNNKDNSYLIIFVSDGKEYPAGCSQKFNARQVAKMLRECQDTGRWTVTYLGANQDLSKLAKELNIPVGNIANYSSDMKGTGAAMAFTSGKLDNYLKLRKRGVSSLKSFHSNDGGMADYTKVDMNSVPDNFDYKSVQLERAKPGETIADIDAVMNMNAAIEKQRLPKSIFRNPK